MTKTIAIIGGGVVGLNIALALSKKDAGDIFVLEREPYLGHHTSTRNSEVIHAGFAYDSGSLKARFCVEGNRLTYALLDELNVHYKKGGKWIVAHSKGEADAVDDLIKNARDCGVAGIYEVDPKELHSKYPILSKPRRLIFSDTSGIMDSSAYIKAMESKLAMTDRVFLVYPCDVTHIDTKDCVLDSSRGEMPFDVVINCAGLYADEVYKMAGGVSDYEIKPYKGEYYSWNIEDDFDALVYPVAKRFIRGSSAIEASNFGIHMHRAVGGEIFLGPSQVSCGAKDDYSIASSSAYFIESISCLLERKPVPAEISPAFAGNRAKLFKDGDLSTDYEIIFDSNAIHLLGMESPGLTAAPAIAKYIVERI